MCELTDMRAKNDALTLREENSRMRAELAELKLEKMSVAPAINERIKSSLHNSQNREEIMAMANRLCKLDWVPSRFQKKPEDILMAISMGTQLGLSVEMSLKEIAIIHNSPCVYGDSLMALALSHADCEFIDEEEIIKDGEVVGYNCFVKRRGFAVHKSSFTLEDAKKSGIFKQEISDEIKKANYNYYVALQKCKSLGLCHKDKSSLMVPWYTYTKRMLQMRARGFAIRDRFSDVLRGLASAEEMRDLRSIRSSKVTEAEFTIEDDSTQTERLKYLINQSKEMDNGIIYDDDDKQIKKEKECEVVRDVKSEDIKAPYSRAAAEYNSPEKDEKIEKASVEQIDEIRRFLKENSIKKERVDRALAYYKVGKLEDLSKENAYDMIEKLTR